MEYYCEKKDKTSEHFNHWADAIGGFTCEFCGEEVETEYEEDRSGDCSLWIPNNRHEFI